MLIDLGCCLYFSTRKWALVDDGLKVVQYDPNTHKDIINGRTSSLWEEYHCEGDERDEMAYIALQRFLDENQ